MERTSICTYVQSSGMGGHYAAEYAHSLLIVQISHLQNQRVDNHLSLPLL